MGRNKKLGYTKILEKASIGDISAGITRALIQIRIQDVINYGNNCMYTQTMSPPKIYYLKGSIHPSITLFSVSNRKDLIEVFQYVNHKGATSHIGLLESK